MKQRWKRIIAYMLTVVMMLGIMPDTLIVSYAEEVSETIIEDATEDKENAEIEEIQNSDEKVQEYIAEVTETDDVFESSTELNESLEDSTEIYTELEMTTSETNTEVVETTECTTEISTEGISDAESNTDTNIEKDAKTQIPKLMTKKELSAQKASSSKVIYSDGSWNDGVVWYVNDGNKKHYVFCLEKGKTMYSGKYTGDITKGYSGSNAFRIGTALDYFKKVNDGWSGKKDYGLVQQVVWNESESALMTYINHAWKIVHNNTNRAASSASYDSRLYAINTPENVSTASGREKIAEKAKARTPSDKDNDGVIEVQYGLQGSAWKYFAKAPMDSTGIDVVGLYDKNGNEIDNPYAGENYVDQDGMLHVKYAMDHSTKLGTVENPVTVIMEVDLPYQGAESFQYLETEGGKQNLTYDVTTNSTAYFAMKFYSNDSEPEDVPTRVSINKVDEFGNQVYGCVFRLQGTAVQSLDNIITIDQEIVVDSQEDYFVIEYEGSYIITETAVPNSEWQINTNSANFSTRWMTDPTTGKRFLQVTNMSGANLSTTDNLNWTYTAKNTFNTGGGKIVKYGNVLKEYRDGQFIYEKRKLPNAEFSFYAAEDIYLNDTLVFEKGTLFTDGLGWGVKDPVLEFGKEPEWSHKVSITNKGITDANGELTITGLPSGLYYALETKTPEGLTESFTRYYFKVTAGSITDIGGPEGIINEQKPATCHVFKTDEERKKVLSGGEFTLYANVNNKNYDGQSIFATAQTVPAVIKRNLFTGEDTIEEGIWIPLKSVITDDRGMAEFSDIPNGKYLIVETKAPEGYNLAEESYIFEHSYSNKQTTSGYNFEHTFKDVKKRIYEIKKHAEKAIINSNADTVNVDAYVYEDAPIEGVKFGIYAAEDIYNTLGVKIVDKGKEIGSCTTNEKGIAEYSGVLYIGKYYFKELQTADDERYILDDKEYSFIVSEDISEQLNDTPIINKQYKGSIKVIKTDGVTKVALSDVEFNLLDSSKEKVLGTYVTDANGELYIKNLPVGTYYIQEVKAKENYILDDALREVTISKENLDHELSITNEEYKGSIKVIKTDGKTKVALSDVEFKLYDGTQTNILGTYVTDEKGEILIHNLSVGTYYLQESKTKKGYKLDDKMVEVVISVDDLHKQVEFENYRTDTKITIKTDSTYSGSGQVRTGDKSPIGFIMLLFLLSSFCAAYFAKKKDARLKPLSIRTKKLMVLALVIASSTVVGGLTVKAAVDLTELSSKEIANAEYNGKVYTYALQKQYETSNQDSRIDFEEELDGMKLADVKYEIIETILQKETLEETKDYKDLIVKDESKIAETITKNGNVYDLQDVTWSEVPNMETLSYIVDYGYQTAEPTPDATYEYTYTSPVMKKDNTAILPFVRLEKGNEDWVDGFSATVTFHNLDGLYFTLGDDEFEYNPDKLSLSDSDYKELVKMLGYDTSKYRLNSIVWSGKEYKKDGKLCRDAKASGQQYATSYKAHYADEVENGKIYTAHATYMCEVEVPAEEESPTYVMQATAYYEDEGGVWTNIITFITEHKGSSAVVFGVLFLFIILVIVWLLKKRKPTYSSDETYTE